MRKKAIFGLMLTLLLMGVYPSAFNPAIARMDGASSPPIYLASAQAEWNRTYGGAELDVAYWVQETNDGGYVVAGWTSSFSIGSSDFWLVKTDAYGNMLWNKTYGRRYADMAYSAKQTSDGGYIMAGRTASFIPEVGLRDDFWLVKTDSEGNMEWNKTYGGLDWDLACSVQQTSDGGYIVAGWTRSFGAGGSDFWVVKTDPDGNMEWNKTYGQVGFEWAYSVQQTSDGGYIVAGETSYRNMNFWVVKTDSIGNMEWNKTYGGAEIDVATSVLQTSEGGYLVAGYTYSFGFGGVDFWVVKTDSMGNMEWNKTYGGRLDDFAGCVQQTSDGGYIIAGKTESIGSGEDDFWLVKTDSEGNMEWSKACGGNDDDSAFSVQQTSDGGYVAAGYTDSYGAGKSDFWVVKLPRPQRDVAIVNVAPAKTIIGQGNSLPVYVAVKNQGDFFTETFNVTVYYDSSPIETKIVFNLPSGGSEKNLTFTWDTNDVPLGNYAISAYATPVPDETETQDNTYVDGTITVRLPIHNIATTAVSPQKNVVGLGYPVNISVAIMNQGDFTENFNVTTYANTTTIQTINVTLASENFTIITFMCNTIGMTKGNYTISASASIVPNETETADNALIDGWVYVGLPGDVDADGDVDIYDIVLITSVYGSKRDESLYNPNVDINDDGTINIYDVVIATSRYGEKEL